MKNLKIYIVKSSNKKVCINTMLSKTNSLNKIF